LHSCKANIYSNFRWDSTNRWSCK